MESMKIAVVQMQAVVGAIDENIAKIGRFAEEAASNQVELLCFPELAVTGYDREKSPLYQETIPGNISERISAIACACGLVILAGMVEASGQEKPYITQLMCFPDGRVDGYRKTHLGASEQHYFLQGEQLFSRDAGKTKVGLALCWEAHFPEIAAILSIEGAEMIFVPHASPVVVGDRKEIWMRYLQARAYDNSIFLAACNLIGTNGYGGDFCGGALILGPKGEIVAEDFSGQEGLLVARLDASIINKIRYETRSSMKNSFYPRYRRPELYGKLVEPLRCGESISAESVEATSNTTQDNQKQL